MKKFLVLGLFVLVISLLGLEPAHGQAQTAPAASLGDLAQKLKSDRAQATRKASKVFTNDNLPARPPEENLTVATGMSKESQGQDGEKSGGASVTAASSGARGEKYFRARMSEIQAQLDKHTRQLEVLQQKLSQNQTQYYADPQKTLTQEFTRTDVNKLTQDVEKKKQEIDSDQKAMDDLRDQLRREGGDPGWLRTAPGQQAASSTAPAEESSGQESAEASTEGKKEDKTKTKEHWQAGFKSARAGLAKAQEEQQLVEDELNLLGIQQARELDANVQNELAQKIAAKKPDADNKRAATAKAQKALEDLEKKFKDSGAPEEWSQTE